MLKSFLLHPPRALLYPKDAFYPLLHQTLKSCMSLPWKMIRPVEMIPKCSEWIRIISLQVRSHHDVPFCCRSRQRSTKASMLSLCFCWDPYRHFFLIRAFLGGMKGIAAQLSGPRSFLFISFILLLFSLLFFIFYFFSFFLFFLSYVALRKSFSVEFCVQVRNLKVFPFKLFIVENVKCLTPDILT